MESREEIQEMRVVELREFLRRHDIQIKNLSRSDGTPGPPRKPELLAAALEVWEDHNAGRLEVRGPATPTSPVPTNPFQTRRLSSAPEDHMTPIRRPPSQLQQRPRVSEAREVQEELAERKSTTRARRRSSNWVDPSLLAQLKAPTPRKPQEPADAKAGAENKHQSTARRPGSYPDTEVGVGLRKRHQQRRPTLVSDEPPPQPSARRVERSGLNTRHRSSSNEAGNLRTERSRAGIENTSRPRRLLDVDEEYISDEDPDYDADQEYVDRNDSDDSDYDEGKRSVEVVDLTHDIVAQKNEIDTGFDDEIQPAGRSARHGQRSRTHHEDIPFDSDTHESDRARRSDPSSALDTEEEDDIVDFNEWRSKDIRDWLNAHDIKFNPAASKVELVGLARAIKIRMETMYDVDDKSDSDEIKERRQGISAPCEDDDVVFVAQSSRKLKRRKSAPRISQRVICLLTFSILGAALVCLWCFAIMSIRVRKASPFCETDSQSNYTETGVLCRKCPRHGQCVNGTLYCDSGYVRSGLTCVSDQKFRDLVIELADHAYKELAMLHGRELCGEPNLPGLSYDDLGDLFEDYVNQKREKNPSLFRDEMEFDRTKSKLISEAQNAMESSEYRERYKVYMDEEDNYRTENAILSSTCRLIKFVLKHHFKIVTVLFFSFIFGYLRWNLFLYRRRKRSVRTGHRRALELLRDQVVGFRNGEEDTAFLSDVILREEALGRSTPYIIEIWKEVEDLLRTDARVLRKHQSVRGMPSYTYEYVGSRRSSGSFFDSFSRRSSSFSSRASLDSLDMRSDSDFEIPQEDSLKSYIFGLIEGK